MERSSTFLISKPAWQCLSKSAARNDEHERVFSVSQGRWESTAEVDRREHIDVDSHNLEVIN